MLNFGPVHNFNASRELFICEFVLFLMKKKFVACIGRRITCLFIFLNFLRVVG